MKIKSKLGFWIDCRTIDIDGLTFVRVSLGCKSTEEGTTRILNSNETRKFASELNRLADEADRPK